MASMTAQLTLIDPANVLDWRLDERTKEIGRKGIATARAELRRVAASARSSADEASATAA